MMCKHSNEALVVCYALCTGVHQGIVRLTVLVFDWNILEGFRRSVGDTGGDNSPQVTSTSCTQQKASHHS